MDPEEDLEDPWVSPHRGIDQWELLLALLSPAIIFLNQIAPQLFQALL
jgi:hypothetical protein